MKKILVVAQREYMSMVATKAFLFTLIMMPVLMFGGLVLMPMIGKIGGGRELKIIVFDHDGEFAEMLQESANARNESLEQTASDGDEEEDFEDRMTPTDKWIFEIAPNGKLDDAKRLELSNQIRDGEIYAFIEIPADVTSMDLEQEMEPIKFVCQDALISPVRQWLTATMRQAVRTKRLEELSLDPELVAKADRPVVVDPTVPYRESDEGDAESDESLSEIVALLLPFGVMMLMFMVIFLAAQPMLESGMEEKSQRIAEVLLGSVTPTQLMSGKLLGNVAGSLLVFLLYGVCGWIVVAKNGWDAQLPWSLMPWFIVFQILGVLFFSSIFLTVGASIRDLKEAQSMLLPVWLILTAPMMVWFVAVRDPNGPIAVALTFFPPSTPMMMMLRMASGQTIPFWQPPLAALLLALSSGCIVWVAGRVYRTSLLSSDSARSFVQILRRFKQST